MSTDAYLRATARESRIWTPFLQAFPCDSTQTEDRAVIFGLYANSHLNQNKYLVEIETEELANLLSQYNSRIAELTAGEQKVVAEIVSKRYLAGIDKLIHDAKMNTKQQEIEADEDIWDAKIAALSADEAALETLAAKVSSETTKTGARITELETYIEVEALNLSMADVEVAEKEIQSAKVDIQKMDVANQVLKIQIDTVRAAQELVGIDIKIARTKIDNAEVERTMNKIDLLASELSIEQAKTKIAQSELPIAAARATLAGAKTQEIQEEINHVATLESQSAETYANRIELMDAKQAGLSDKLDMQRDEKTFIFQNKIDIAQLDVDFANADSTLQESIDSKKADVMSNNASNAWLKAQAAISVQETLAKANIVNTLTHSIEKK